MERLSENWKIFIASSFVAIVVLMLTLSWLTIQQLEEVVPYRSRIQIDTVKMLEGISPPEEKEVPLSLVNWTYPEGYKQYTIVTENRGIGIAKKIRIDIDFTPNIIGEIIENNDLITIKRGG
ncbi:MAG: hypothetical protein LUO93_04955 [Methanomicrobiales archaeon]|nr:hypothetical protein [Methanomicrobiales archaeon]